MAKNIFRFSAIILLIAFSCSGHKKARHKEDIVAFDLDSIKAKGIIRAVTDFNSTSYFLYRGEPMGFQYELLKSFADHLGVSLEIIPEQHPVDAIEMLHTGKVDLLAMSLTANDPLADEIQLTTSYASTCQVIVQRIPHRKKTISSEDKKSGMLRSYSDLAEKTIYVEKGSSHAGTLYSVAREIGKRINVIEVPFDAEVLIQMVAKGEIDYVACDENLALVNATYYPDVDVSTQMSADQDLSWGIRKNNSSSLRQELDRWLPNFRKTKTFAVLYSKYFRNSRSSDIVKSDYYTLNTGRFSQWDDLIKVFSDSINWDWRLLTSLIYQESRFMADVKSWAGAYGLMQIMPETGKNFGIDITASPRNNLIAGAKYINWLHSIFDPRIPDEDERTRFILAAYNAGPGHVLDAMKLAEKNGKDPTLWDDNVAEWLLKKSEPRYYTDAVVKNGYFSGKESVAFVNEIMERYEHYKNIIPNSEN